MKKKIVLILCGGRTTEHEVSLMSAANVVAAMSGKYIKKIIVIDKQGQWFLVSEAEFLEIAKKGSLKRGGRKYMQVALVPGDGQMGVVDLTSGKTLFRADIVFPVLHGAFWEDGTMQGLFEVMNVPYIGPGVLGSALAMDKEYAKRLFVQAGIPTAGYRVVRKGEEVPEFSNIRKDLGCPVFVKPARSGSSVGVSRASDEKSFRAALREAFKYDDKILIEEMLVGREVECSVLGNEGGVEVSVPGEVVPAEEYGFYSYESKYIDENGAELIIPAKLGKAVTEKVRTMAAVAFEVLGCEGMARADFFVTMRGKVYVNELNTLPGFTNISMYPKLWEESGLSQGKLIDTLIRLGIERWKREQKKLVSYE